MKGLHNSEAPFLVLWLMTVVQYHRARERGTANLSRLTKK